MVNRSFSIPHKWWILIAAAACLSLSFFDITSVSVSLPSIQRELHSSNLTLQWVINAYTLALAMFIILGGRLGDIYRHHNIFILGVAIFAISSFTCALADTTSMLICSRFLQGLGAALYTPNLSVLVYNAFPENERGKAIGLTIGSASVFLAFGPFIGGIITQLISWRLIFWINIPLTLLSIYIIHSRRMHMKSHIAELKKIDWWGLITFSSGIALLVFSIMQSMQWGWRTPLLYILVSLSFLLFYCFYRIETKVLAPIINFNIFRNKPFLACVILWACLQIAIITTVFRAIWFQNVLGYSAGMAGLLALPSTLPILFMAPIAGRLLDKYGPRLLLITGLSLSFLGLGITAFAAPWQNYFYILPGLILMGFGIPICTTATSTTALKVVEQNMIGMSSGIINTLRQVGGTVGLALVGSIITTIYTTHLNQLLQTFPNVSNITSERLDGLLAGSSKAHQLVSQLPISAVVLYDNAKHFYTLGFEYGNYVASLFLLISLVSIVFLLKE